MNINANKWVYVHVIILKWNLVKMCLILIDCIYINQSFDTIMKNYKIIYYIK